MNNKISRRQLLKILGAAAGGVGLAKVLETSVPFLLAQELNKHLYLPMLLHKGSLTPPPAPTPTATATSTATSTATVIDSRTPTPTATPTGTRTPGSTRAKVVHMHAAGATSWNFSSGWYGDYVDQDIVNDMVDVGLKQLTGQSTVTAAWQTLLPGYASGKGIAIKVNFNNASYASCAYSGNVIDSLIEPVNALIRGMKLIGVRETDIWVYDASRTIPARFRSGCPYSGVRFLDRFWDVSCAERASFSSNDPDAWVYFGNPKLTQRRITNVAINATYLINVPIVKDHGIGGVTLGFKNHFGTIDEVEKGGEDSLHLNLGNLTNNPQVDIYLNSHIRNKTALIVGDGLFGALGNTNVVPSRWQTFGNDASNSLFFGTDPVAMDCVMFDILDADPAYHPRGDGHMDNYLKAAANAGLGIFERGDPWGSGYHQISYQKIER